MAWVEFHRIRPAAEPEAAAPQLAAAAVEPEARAAEPATPAADCYPAAPDESDGCASSSAVGGPPAARSPASEMPSGLTSSDREEAGTTEKNLERFLLHPMTRSPDDPILSDGPNYSAKENNFLKESTSMSILSETVQRMLQEPVPEEPKEDLFAVPRNVAAREIADIPKLRSVGEACQLALDMKAEIDVIECRRQVAARAEWLEHLRLANHAARCRHVLSKGETCGCPALKGTEYCRFHGQAHATEVELPIVEDADSLQLAYMSVAQQLVTKKIDAARARVLLQTIECAARNLQSYAAPE